MQQIRLSTQYSTGIQQEAVQLLHWLKQHHYQFSTISPHSHASYLERRQQASAKTIQDIFGWSLPFDASLLPESLFQSLQQAELLQSVQQQWRSKLRVASIGNQLFIHSAYPTLEEHAVFFGPDTYRFVYALKQCLQLRALQQQPLTRALELCSGAAPAALTIAKHAPNAEVIATDINTQALQFAQINALFNQASHMQVIHSNLFEALKGHFDLITANPPYLVDEDKRLYRHGGSLLGAELALKIVKQSLDRLNIGGQLFLYTGIVIAHGQDLFKQQVVQHLQPLADHYSLSYEELDSDIFAEELNPQRYPDAERIAAVILIIQRLS